MNHRLELATLVELERHGNARAAAEALGVSQSTVSETLARLEKQYGTQLFTRDRRGSRPTLAGSIMIEAARSSLETLDNAQREVDLLLDAGRGALAVGAHPLLASSHLAPAIDRAFARHPHLRCVTRLRPPTELIRMLRARELEVVLCIDPDPPHHDLVVEHVGEVRPVAFCRPGHPLLDGPVQGVEAILRFPFAAPAMPEWYIEAIGTVLEQDLELARDLATRARTVEVEDQMLLESMVASTNTIGLALFDAIRDHVADGRFTILDLPEEQAGLLRPAPLAVVTLPRRRLPPAAETLIDAFRELGSPTGGGSATAD